MKNLMKWLVMGLIAVAAWGHAVSMARAEEPIPYTLMQSYTLKRVNVPIVAGAWKWTNTYQNLSVVSVEIIGAQTVVGYHTGTYTVVSGTPATPTPSWAVITNSVTNIVASGVGNTATAYALATNTLASFYADVFTGAGAGTNAGTALIKGYAPAN